jgi:hypothetical protein
MAVLRPLLLLAFLPLLAGCYEDQKERLAACETQSTRAFPRPLPGEPLKSIQSCMDRAGYRFIGWNDGVVCDMTALVAGKPSPSEGDVICFEPKNWLSRRLYRIDVPEKSQIAS